MKNLPDQNFNRTSHTHPLLINELKVGAGTVGMTFCPGKRGVSIYGAPWDRNLETDIGAIANWGAALLITIMTDEELSSLDVPNLGCIVSKYGMEWYHLKIEDLSAPNSKTQDSWDKAKWRAFKYLNKGEKVLVHCRGGLGRTGTFAADLLLERGGKLQNVLKLVRNARPGAVETHSQVLYLARSRNNI